MSYEYYLRPTKIGGGRNMKQILLAGGCGFIGSHLADRICRRNDFDRLVVVDNLWTGRIENLEAISDSRVEFVQSDVETFTSDTKFDEIYHLASPASPPWYMTQPLRTISANVVGALNLLTLLKPGGTIGYTSTSEVYGDPVITPQPETYRGSVDCTGPRSSYDESKRCVEAMLFEAHRVHGTRVKVVRLFNVYGPRTRPDDGRAVSNFITQALQGKPITVYGDGSQTRSWGHIDDIVEALERYFWRDGTDYPGPLNIGNDREISVIEVAEFIQSHFPKSPIVHLPPVVQDPTNRRPDLTLCNKILPGWACAIPYEEGVMLSTEWFRKEVLVPA
jgi:nucleoside-diphosphate-sugar epimerase